MRVAWLLVILAGCGAGASRGPSWPKTAAAETDGGESLSPHTATAKAAAAAAVADDSDDDAKPAAPVTPAAKSAAPAADKPAAASPATPAAEEPINTEEIVIEIDD